MPDSDQSALPQQHPRLPARVFLVGLALSATACVNVATKHPASPVVGPPPADAGDDRAPASAPPFAGDIDAQTIVLPLGETDEIGIDDTGSVAATVVGPKKDVAIWRRLRLGYRLDDISHPRIESEIQRLRYSPQAFRALMTRAEPFLRYILDQVETADLPTELALLPAVESGFRPHVYSPDGAAGLWQFMPATGRMLGLGRDWWFDERQALRSSTPAALIYLKRLNERFSGDWLHTLAAYNAGARKVRHAIARARSRGESTDFWSLDLPGETDAYVPRLLALATVVADPQTHGLDLPDILDKPYFATADTAGQIDLQIAARLADMPIETLMTLNAGHRRWVSRPEGPHKLLLPIAKRDGFEEAVAGLPDDERRSWRLHSVRPGDSLWVLGRRYGVSIDAIRQANRLRSSRIQAGRDLLIPLSDAVAAPSSVVDPRSRQRLHYRVRKGDSLYKISRRFQVSIADLKRWNHVGRYIRPGERLTVYIDPGV